MEAPAGVPRKRHAGFVGARKAPAWSRHSEDFAAALNAMEFYAVDSVFKRLQDVGEHPDRRRSMTLTSVGGCGRSDRRRHRNRPGGGRRPAPAPRCAMVGQPECAQPKATAGVSMVEDELKRGRESAARHQRRPRRLPRERPFGDPTNAQWVVQHAPALPVGLGSRVLPAPASTCIVVRRRSSCGSRMRSWSCAEKASISVIDALAGVTYSASR